MPNNSKNLVTSYPPKQASIHTANGETKPVIAEGSIKVSSSMELDYVLVVP